MPIPTGISIAITVVSSIMQFGRDYLQDSSADNLAALVKGINENLQNLKDGISGEIAQSYIDQDFNDIYSNLENASKKLDKAGTAACYSTAEYYHDIASSADIGFAYVPRLWKDISEHEEQLQRFENSVIGGILYARTLLTIMLAASVSQDICSNTPGFHEKYREDQLSMFNGHISQARLLLRDYIEKKHIEYGERPGEHGPSGRAVNIGYYEKGDFNVVEEIQKGPGFQQRYQTAQAYVRRLIQDLKTAAIKSIDKLA